jgi:CBS domain-containing protein
MRAGELCIRDVVTAERGETVADAANRMSEYNVGDLIVVEHRQGKVMPIGILTDRDLVIRVLTRESCVPAEIRIDDVIREEVVFATDDEDIESVLAKLKAHRIRRIPVVDRHGALQGILTFDDIVGWIADQLDTASTLVTRQAEIRTI